MNAQWRAAAAIAVVIVAAGPAVAFEVVGSEELPILQTDDGQTFPGWSAALDACLAKAPKPVYSDAFKKYLGGVNCNRDVTYRLAKEEADRELRALSSPLRDMVKFCMGDIFEPHSLSSFQRQQNWSLDFDKCQKVENVKLILKEYEERKWLEGKARQKQLHDAKMIGLILAILVAAVVALICRARIARAGRYALITVLTTRMRIGRARDRFIDGAVNEAKTRLRGGSPLGDEAGAVDPVRPGEANAVDAALTVSAGPAPRATAGGAMRGFLIGAGVFIGWWMLMVLVFGLAGLMLALVMGGIGDALHIVLWCLYVATVVIGGVRVVMEKDAIIARLLRRA